MRFLAVFLSFLIGMPVLAQTREASVQLSLESVEFQHGTSRLNVELAYRMAIQQALEKTFFQNHPDSRLRIEIDEHVRSISWNETGKGIGVPRNCSAAVVTLNYRLSDGQDLKKDTILKAKGSSECADDERNELRVFRKTAKMLEHRIESDLKRYAP